MKREERRGLRIIMVSTFLALFHESIVRRFLAYMDREVMFLIFSVQAIASKTASKLLPTLLR